MVLSHSNPFLLGLRTFVVFGIGLSSLFPLLSQTKVSPFAIRFTAEYSKSSDFLPESPNSWKRLSWTSFEGPLLIGYEKDPIWVRLRLSDPEINTYLYLENPVAYVDEVSLFRWNGNSYQEWTDGDKYPKRKSIVPEHPFVLFRITSGVPDSDGYLYLRYKSISSLVIQPKLYSPEAFLNQQSSVREWNFFYFSVLLLVFLLNLLFYSNTRNPSFLYYSVYVFSAGMYQWIHTGLAKVYFWPDWGIWNDLSLLLFGSFALVSVVWFSCQFLSLGKRLPKWNRFFQYSSLVCLTNALVGSVFRNQSSLWLVHGLGLLLPLLLLGIGLYFVWTKQKIGYFYSAAWTVLFLFVITFNFYSLGILPENFLTTHSIQLGTLAEMFLFHLAVLDRIRGREDVPASPKKLAPQDSSEAKRELPARLQGIPLQAKIQEMEEILREEKLYCDEDLDLQKMAEVLDLRPDQVSALVNFELGQSFNQYINRFRIEEAKEMIRKEPERNILSIAFAVGFNSKSTFYDAFQKITGLTPKEYKKSPDS